MTKPRGARAAVPARGARPAGPRTRAGGATQQSEEPATGRWPRRLERSNLVQLGLTAVATVLFAVRYFSEDVDAGHTQRDGWAPLMISGVLFALSLSAALLRPFLLTSKRCALMATGGHR